MDIVSSVCYHNIEMEFFYTQENTQSYVYFLSICIQN